MYFYCYVYVFLLLCMFCSIYSVFIVLAGIFRLPWLRFFRAFSSVVRQMPEYNLQRRGTARTISKLIVLFCLLFVCKCVRTVLVLLPQSVNPIAVNKYICLTHFLGTLSPQACNVLFLHHNPAETHTVGNYYYYYYYYYKRCYHLLLHLCKVLTFTYLEQTMFLGYIVLQLFCSYNFHYM
jgi:hypothetical protein